jgi:threonine dehydratase
MIGLDDIRAAAARIAPHVRRTPLWAATALAGAPTPAELLLKLECLQVSGSFKARGALSKLLAMPAEALSRGVVTASGGNHGLAVTRAAALVGVPARVFVPETTSPAKIARLRALGAAVTVTGTVWNDTAETARAAAAAQRAAFIHPFADPAVVAGQGTLALEILDQGPPPDAVLVAIGGGGLIAGMGAALKALSPATRVIGIEPVGSPTLHAALAAGRVVRLSCVTTRVATMACAETDPDLFALARRVIDDVVLVEDDDLLAAARWLWQECGLAADLSGAAAVAALRTGAVGFAAGERVVALVCGAGPEGLT